MAGPVAVRTRPPAVTRGPLGVTGPAEPASGKRPVVKAPAREEILPYLAPRIRRPIERLGADLWTRTEEVRLRRGRPLSVVTGEGDLWLSPQGLPTTDPGAAHTIAAEDITRTLALVTQGSVYALEEEFRHGFVTLPGGHRVGMTGRTLLEAGHIRTIAHVGGLSVRLSREVKGVARPLVSSLVDRAGRPLSTIILPSGLREDDHPPGRDSPPERRCARTRGPGATDRAGRREVGGGRLLRGRAPA